ncbi:TolB-like protein [Rhodoligotrophos appendicifer]|uniref:transcriptional regulator n=1 Tax=Rhodoligotrophos appendicifer TaxID=987056 RepID=UPI00118519B8|nr:transcriptional regulator [Rhodoligotrophos appendicifer]
METQSFIADQPSGGLTLKLFGPLALSRDGSALTLPASRKVRALLAYLAVSPRPVGRSRLCELLGDAPNDPRGELRWCLSKLRSVLKETGCERVLSRGEMISLDLLGCRVDALEIEAAAAAGWETCDIGRLEELSGLLMGDFLEGLELNRSPQLDHWIMSQRRRYRASHAAMLGQVSKLLMHDPQVLRPYAERRVSLMPFDYDAQILLLRTLLLCDEPREAEQHFDAVMRLFNSENLSTTSLSLAWREMRKGVVNSSVDRALSLDHEEKGTTAAAQAEQSQGQRRPSIAIMPIAETEDAPGHAGFGAGLTHDIITRLAKLRSIFVIARGSVFSLAGGGLAPHEAARRLDVDYFASGLVRRRSNRTVLTIELVDARTGRIVWTEQFEIGDIDSLRVIDDIGDRIVASIASEIETAEKSRAILKPPNSLTAWEAYHRGLWHVYRFTRDDNELAQRYFRRSSEIDPTYARALAGLSFTHWQNAFQRWADREREVALALETAGRSVLIDDHDPAAHWAMGRALWLGGGQEQAVGELTRAVDLSPNFALGHYALAFVLAQSGDPQAAILSADQSRQLSPFDPLLFGMLAARALALVRLERYEEAAEWAVQASAKPNAHTIILAIAAHCLALAGRLEEGKLFAARIRQSLPLFGVADFLGTFRFPPDVEVLLRRAARRIGLD